MQIRKQIEKMRDLEIGKEMAIEAEENVRQEYLFRKMKKERARELLVKHWDQQVKLKESEEIVNRVF